MELAQAKPRAAANRMSPVLTIDDLAFEVRHSASRKTLGLTVGRMGELVLSLRRGT